MAALAGLIWVGARAAESVQRAQRAFPTDSGRLALAGLEGPVSVLRDARGIPHVEASRAADAWLALGFAHAQDRLGQMLWLRRLARGRTAEVVGDPGLRADRLARTLGIGLLADREVGSLAPGSRQVLSAYSAGVNAQIDRLRSGQLAPPLALRSRVDEIQDWAPGDSIAVLKLIAWSSGNLLDTGIVLDELIRVLGGALAAPLRPGGEAALAAPAMERLAARSWPMSGGGASPDLPTPGHPLADSTRIAGGTAWVLGARHSASGSPILVADLHLPATVPSLVYQAQLRSPGLDIVGATIPGIPVFWFGRNPRLAWAAIPAGAITVDLYTETVREREGTYHDGEGWKPLEVRQELIRVREAASYRDEELLVRSTRHGPLVGSLLAGPREAGAPPIALAWTGMVPGDGISSLLGAARARDAEQLRSSLATHHEPVLAVVYAETAGKAGLQLAGWLPERTLPSSLVPVPGRMRIYDWGGPIPFRRLPALRMNASASPSGPGGRQWLTFSDGVIGDGANASGIEWLWRPGERSRRLDAGLAQITQGDSGADAGPTPGESRLDLRRAAAFQRDLGAGGADEVVPAVLRLARAGGALSPEAEEILEILARWDGNLAPESQGAAAYSVLNLHLFAAFFETELGEALSRRYLALPGVDPGFMVGRVLLAADRRRASGGWADLERVAAGLGESLRLTWVTLANRLGPSRSDWRWGELHGLEFRPFVGLEGEERLRGGLGRIGVGGDASSLADSRSQSDGFEVWSASTYRLAVDLSAPDRLLTSLAPGQSEHPRHPHFSDGVLRWRQGRPGVLSTSRLHVEEESRAPLLLEPAS